MKIQTVKLNELCKMQSGGTPNRSESKYYGGDIAWAKISDLESSGDGFVHQTEETITAAGLKAINGRIFSSGTLLLAMYGSVGKTAIANIELSTNQAILGIQIKDSTRLDLKYLKHWLFYAKDGIINRARGVALQNISLSIVKELEIPLPPLAEQIHIARVLDQADRLRQQDRQLLAHYDQLVQALFMNMFGDPVRNEKGWPVKSLGLLTKSFKYGTNQKSESDEALGSVPVIRIPNVLANKVNFDDLKFSVLSKQEFADVRLEKGDLLFVRSNGNPAYIGRCAVFAGEIGAAYASYLIRARLHIDLVVPEFIQTVVSFKTYRPVVLKKATTTAGNYNINTQALKSLDVIVPPLILQQKFIQAVTQIEVQKSATQQLQAQSEALFNSLLQQAFRGELTRQEPAAGPTAGQLSFSM